MERSSRVADGLKGPVVPLNICFGDDGSVDFGAVTRYVNWLCESGVPVILITYGSSEQASLTEEETWRLTSDIADVTSGRSLFVAGTGYWKASRCREFLVHADDAGADAVIVQVDPSLPLQPGVYDRFFDLLDGASDIPLLLLDALPPVSLAAGLAARPNVVGAKIHDFRSYYDLTRATRDEEFAVISAGQMRNMVFGHQAGSPAYLCPIAPFMPAVALEFYEHVTECRYDEAWGMVWRYEEPWIAGATGVGWLQAIKTALHLRGLYPNNLPCPPLPPATAEQYETVRRTIEEVFGPIERLSL